MAELVTLCTQILTVLRIRLYFKGYPLQHLQAVPVEARALGGVVREQSEIAEPEVHEDLGADPVVALIRLEAERMVRLDGVHTLLLQLVSANLVVQADAPTLLAQVHDDPAPGILDDRHRLEELRAAVAAQRLEDVAGETLRVHAHEHRRLA